MSERENILIDALISVGHISEQARTAIGKLKAENADLHERLKEAEHRAEVAERAFDKAVKLAYKIRTDFDVLSCSSCEFGYAFDVCKKTGLYSDCENRWKEELLQQAEKEPAEERKDD